MPSRESREARRPRRSHDERRSQNKRSRYPRGETSASTESTQPLSVDSLAQLNKQNEQDARRSRTKDRTSRKEPEKPRRERSAQQDSPRKERSRRRDVTAEEELFIEKRDRRRDSERRDAERQERKKREEKARRREESERRQRREEYESDRQRRREEYERQKRREERRQRREVSGALLEEGDGKRLRTLRDLPGLRGGQDEVDEKHYLVEKPKRKGWSTWSKRTKICIIIGIIVLLLIIIIPVAVVESNKSSSSNSGTSSGSSGGADGGDGNDNGGTPNNSNLDGMSESDIPPAARGTYLDPFTWYDTTDFNVTYTNVTVGGLPIMGLNSTWDDSTQANSRVPPLNKDWGSYASTPARGVNLGGWLSLEPFITPSLFNYDESLGIIDEWTLCTYLGDGANSTIEPHYSEFVTEQTFADIANAGLDHVRIPYSYWAVAVYDDDPYVFRTSWRYLLRGIEWARKYGLRVNLDLHGLPGSQNGWNHSGRQGLIRWLNGTDGDLNAQRSLDVHNQLSQFFAQDRYKNIISFYGLANEPKMTALVTTDVTNWTASAYDLVTKNGINAYVVFGDGFMGLENWQGKLTGYDNLLLDVHQYEIFNVNQIVYNHTTKVTYACQGWTEQADQSMNTATGFGPTIFAEWSQADTDCAYDLNNVGVGNRWTGTYNSGDPETQVLSPTCPTANNGPACECDDANADPSDYSDTYKQFLLMFAEAQMYSFEQGWGWFYWTWKTESAAQWSYEQGLAAGILPSKAWERDFDCSQSVPSFSDLPENY